jgi:hypothetical protein
VWSESKAAISAAVVLVAAFSSIAFAAVRMVGCSCWTRRGAAVASAATLISAAASAWGRPGRIAGYHPGFAGRNVPGRHSFPSHLASVAEAGGEFE